MKILSLNLHCFKEENRIAKLDRIIDFIKENDIDLCMFQEAAQDVNEGYINESIREGNNTYYISSKLNYNIYYHYIKHSFGHLEEGLAFVSKYPIKNPNFIYNFLYLLSSLIAFSQYLLSLILTLST